MEVHMNNSTIKQLIREKGFLYANSRGMVALMKPDTNRAVWATPTVIEWLKGLADVVNPSVEYKGRYVGDQVQVFSPIDGYLYWGLIGRITKVEADRKAGTSVTVQINDETSITVPGAAVTVINREGVVDLRGMSPEERDAAIAMMTAPKPAQQPIHFVCECKGSQHCESEIDEMSWRRLNDLRDGRSQELGIISQYCVNLGGVNSGVVARDGDLLLIELPA